MNNEIWVFLILIPAAMLAAAFFLLLKTKQGLRIFFIVTAVLALVNCFYIWLIRFTPDELRAFLHFLVTLYIELILFVVFAIIWRISGRRSEGRRS